MRIDLHVHSTASDGSYAPAAVIQAARAGGLHVLALADHDTVGGVAAAQAAGAGALHVIPAIELSTHHAGNELHMLGYYVDPLEAGLLRYSVRASGAREVRMREMLDRLAALNITVSFDDVLVAAGPKPDSIGRPHLARALLQRGYVQSMNEAFDRFIGDDGPAFVPTRLITADQAIEIIHQAGGVAVWAHPRQDRMEAELPRLQESGLDGVECFRPRVPPPDSDRIAATARARGLLVTGGSDWHGEWHGRLGDFFVDRDDVAQFLDVGGI
ncbi:MAG: PHP domain-containing protein [Gemmatimonadota bacterium]